MTVSPTARLTATNVSVPAEALHSPAVRAGYNRHRPKQQHSGHSSSSLLVRRAAVAVMMVAGRAAAGGTRRQPAPAGLPSPGRRGTRFEKRVGSLMGAGSILLDPPAANCSPQSQVRGRPRSDGSDHGSSFKQRCSAAQANTSSLASYPVGLWDRAGCRLLGGMADPRCTLLGTLVPG